MDAEQKKLSKLSRAALLELLVEQSRELDRLRLENEALRTERDALRSAAPAKAQDPLRSRDAAIVAAALIKVDQVLEKANRIAAQMEEKA